MQVGAKDKEGKETQKQNIVTIDGIKFKGAAAIYGGYAANVANNTWANAQAYTLAYANGDADAAHSFTASSNTVKVSGITGADSVEVYGGFAANVADNEYVHAKAYASAVVNASAGACGAHSFTASSNTVKASGIEGAKTVKVYGGYAANVVDKAYSYADASANAYVYANADAVADADHSFTASSNKVKVSGITGADSVEVYGGFAANVADNNGTASADINAYIYYVANADADHSFTASSNKQVDVSGIEGAKTVKVYGGYAANVADNNGTADASVEVNVSADGSASADHSFKASDNEVNVSNIDADTVEVYGGYAANVGSPDKAQTWVTVNNYANAYDDKVFNATASHTFAASDNKVTVSNVKASDSVKVYGGLAENTPVLKSCVLSNKGNTVQITESVAASGNKVCLYNVDAKEVCGGRSSVTLTKDDSVDLAAIAYEGVTIKGTAEASNNTVELHGGSFTGSNLNLYAGYSSAVVLKEEAATGKCSFEGTAASAKDNTLALYAYQGASPKLDGAVLWGGFAEYTVNGETFEGTTTGNTLEFHEAKGMTAKNIKNFSTLEFTLPAMAAGDAVLTLTDADGTDISNATVEVKNEIIEVKGADGGEFKVGDEVVLLKNANGLAKDGVSYTKEKFDGQPDASTQKILGQTGISLQYQLELQQDENSIFLKCSNATKTGGTTVLPQTKAVAEGAAAGLALAGESANAAIELARSFSPETGIMSPFVHVGGSSVTHETGSSVHLNSISLAAGIGTGLETGAGKLSAGAFFEYGKGSYTTSNSFDNAPSVNGDGTSWYMGGGILAKMDFIPTGPGHFYVEGSAHMGQLHNEYDSSDLRDAGGRIAKFDMDSPYYSLHGGLGYVWNITEDHDLDVYGNYIWTRVQGTDETLTTGDKFEFDDMDSSRVRFGARYTYQGNERFKPYIGAAYEHEFAGSCESTAFGHDVAAPSFEGDTGVGELGITMTPAKDLPLSVNLGVQGYLGQKQGVSGSCLVKYEF